MDKVRHTIHQFDMFAAAPTLRAKGQPEIANSCTGIFSILFVGFFIYVLIDMWRQIITYDDIVATQRAESNLNSIRNETITGFAVLFQDYGITELQPMFKFEIQKITMNGTAPIQSVYYDTQICTDDRWTKFGNNYYYGDLEMLCLQQGQTIQLINDPTKGIYDMLTINIYPCSYFNQTKDVECYDQELIDIFMQLQKQYDLFFTARLYIDTKAFDPVGKDPVANTTAEIKATFTNVRGTEKTVFLDHYTIQTDQSLLPWKTWQTLNGWMVGKEQQASFEVVEDFYLARFVILESSQTKKIVREIGKLDDALAYVGGLFGIVIGFFAFFLMSYNQYKYELEVGENAFNYGSDGKKFKSKKFHFFHYIKYSLYDWCDFLFCCKLGQWGKCEQIHQTREEANEQLNVSYLFRRLQYYERVFEYLLTNEERMSLYLTEPPSLEDVTKTRKYSQYYAKIIRGKSALTLEDIEIIDDVLAFGLQMIGESPPQKLVKITDKENRPGFPSQQLLQSRKDILNMALIAFAEDCKIEKLKIDESDKEVQLQMAKALFCMPFTERSKIQEKIPLKILKRLKDVYEAQKKKEEENNMIQNSQKIQPEVVSPLKDYYSPTSSHNILKDGLE